MSEKEYSFAGKIARAFTYNKPLSLLVLVGVLLAGTIMYLLTPKQYNPEIVRPAFEVVVDYPGARADEVELFVTRELTEKINDLAGVDEIFARSFDGGRSVVMVTFHVGEDLEDSKVKLFTQIEQHLDMRKGAIEKPIIKNVNPDDVPILSVALTSTHLSQGEVRTLAVDIMDELKRVPEVANLEVYGGEPRALKVVLDTLALRERNVSVGEVLQAIRGANVKAAVGSVEDGVRRTLIEADGSIQTPADAARIVVSPGVYLEDVALITDGYREKESYVLYATPDTGLQNAVYISLAKRPGANTPTVSEAAQAKLQTVLKEEKYAALYATVVRDDGAVASKAISDLGLNLGLSILVVGLTLFLFIGARPALVVMLAIPMTLLLVFVAGYLFGQTINRITLFALILSLGLLVFSATVVVENIFRHLKEGEDMRKAIVHAVHQVGMGLFLSTVTSVIVFFPMNYITGMMGPYMGPIAFFVPAALIMSLLVAYIITPFLSHMILKNPTQSANAQSKVDFFTRIENWYEGFLASILSSRKKQKKILFGFLGVLLIVLTFPIFQLIHFQMLPKADKEQYYIYIDAREGTDIEETQNFVDDVHAVVLADSATQSIQTWTGTAPIVDFNGMFKGAGWRIQPHQSTLRVNLVDQADRKESSSHIASAMRESLHGSLTFPEGMTVRIMEDPPGPPVQATFVANIKGENGEMRERIASIVLEALNKTPGVVDIETSIPEAYPRIVARVDTEKALNMGVSTQSVAETLQAVLNPLPVSQYHPEDQNEYAPIELSFPKKDRDIASDLANVDIKSARGTLIPLASVTTHEYSRNIPVLYSDNLEPTTSIGAEVDGRSIVYVMIDVIQALHDYEGSTGRVVNWDLFGLDYETIDGVAYRIEWGGEWKMTLENFRDLGIAMGVAFLLVYGLLVAQYRSFLIPGLIMMTVPFGLVGIIPGFAVLDALDDIYLTATALIGFIALIGIVVNNAILYLEHFTELIEEEGWTDDKKALIEAGKVRMRPIVLTSLMTVLGSLTIAFDPVWSGLAWSIVFGLSLSAIMTLGIFPILYVWFAKK